MAGKKKLTADDLEDALAHSMACLRRALEAEQDFAFKAAGAVKILGELYHDRLVLDARLAGTLGSTEPVPSGSRQAGEGSNLVRFPVR